jgi:hypothetical protein
MLDSVITTMGDSAVPSLSLLASKISTNFTFFYTIENQKNAESFKTFCEIHSPETNVEFLELPSISMPGEIVKYAKEYMGGKDERVGVFLTSGAKQTIFPFLINSQTSTTVSLVHSPLRILVEKSPNPTESVPIVLSLEELLSSRGWVITGENGTTLKNGDLVISDVAASFDAIKGLLSFTSESHLLKTGKENEIHSLPKKEKVLTKEIDQATISNLVLLSEYFGRNGASYVINGVLRSPNRSVLPTFIKNGSVKMASQEEE